MRKMTKLLKLDKQAAMHWSLHVGMGNQMTKDIYDFKQVRGATHTYVQRRKRQRAKFISPLSKRP